MSFRRVRSAVDDPALRLIAADEVRSRLFALPDELTAPLIGAQLSAKFTDLERRHPDAVATVAVVEGAPVGYMITDRVDDVLRLCDIAVAAGARGRGHGRDLLSEILAEADAGGLAIELSVWHDAPARDWYERHGFLVVGGDRTAYLEMRRECHSIHSVA